MPPDPTYLNGEKEVVDLSRKMPYNNVNGVIADEDKDGTLCAANILHGGVLGHFLVYIPDV